jgi:membrane dipeptidase
MTSLRPDSPHPTRRDLLRGMAGSGLSAAGSTAGRFFSGALGALGALGASGCSNPLRSDVDTAALVDSVIGIDVHSHAAGVNGRREPTYDLAARLRNGRMTAVCLCHSADVPVIRREPGGKIVTVRIPEPGELWRYTQRRLGWVDSMVQAQGLRRALKRGDLEALHTARTPAIVQAIEGSQFLEGRLERIEEVFARGVRHLQIVHFLASDMGDNQTEPATQGGLTALGRQAIAECNRLGLVVDLAHATMEFVEAAAKASRTPLLISHTAVAKRDDRMQPFTRHISSAHARLVAQTGGVIGIWCAPLLYRSIDQWVDGIAHAVDIAGADHVAMGTDNSGFGEFPAVWDDYSDFPLVVGAMRRRGFSPQEIRKIAGGNYVRLFNQSMRA